ncbi:hypothetical protein EYF80_019401 [Liparis tanakae]|uniref:Uncharacterized protein n=1 Tax=Liparis tanakae TaxID=230148 RepID=A0A4Z2HYH9_9TELE|nr:hypothetical protein EYF80_019401 [Liparis tanakae]
MSDGCLSNPSYPQFLWYPKAKSSTLNLDKTPRIDIGSEPVVHMLQWFGGKLFKSGRELRKSRIIGLKHLMLNKEKLQVAKVIVVAMAGSGSTAVCWLDSGLSRDKLAGDRSGPAQGLNMEEM